MTKRKFKPISIIRYNAYWISCSIDTKKNIDELFIAGGYEKNIEHIIICGNKLFSIIEFKKSNISYTKMIVISKYGIDKLNKLCADLHDINDIRATILRYFSAHCDYKYSKNSATDKLIALLASHYHDNRNRSMYNNSETGRCLCLLYPVTRDIDLGITTLLNNISQIRSDSIIKDRIQFI